MPALACTLRGGHRVLAKKTALSVLEARRHEGGPAFLTSYNLPGWAQTRRMLYCKPRSGLRHRASGSLSIQRPYSKIHVERTMALTVNSTFMPRQPSAMLTLYSCFTFVTPFVHGIHCDKNTMSFKWPHRIALSFRVQNLSSTRSLLPAATFALGCHPFH